jgi:hypothetical protein
VSAAFIVRYDPGGEGAHGVAALEERQENTRWNPAFLNVKVAHSFRDALASLHETCGDDRIIAAGIDTLTEWNNGVGGWRSADSWLRKTYPTVAKSIVSPNYLSGSMAVNGAAFLTLLAPRFRSNGTMVTEAHPKVCFFAMTGKKHAWADDKVSMAAWLVKELGVDAPARIFGEADHCFDAGVALLAALRGINRDWTLDLRAVPSEEGGNPVQFFGQTHYSWPST